MSSSASWRRNRSGMPWKPTNSPHRGITFHPLGGHLPSLLRKSRKLRKSQKMLQIGYTMGCSSKFKNTKSREYCTLSPNFKCPHLHRWFFRCRFLSFFWTLICNYLATRFCHTWCETLLFRKLRSWQNFSSVGGFLAKWTSTAENSQDLCRVLKFLS